MAEKSDEEMKKDVKNVDKSVKEEPKKKKEGLFVKLKKKLKEGKEDEIKQNIITHPSPEEGTVGYDENVMSPEEFDEIEKDEKVVEEVKETNLKIPESVTGEATKIDQVTMKLERMEGRIGAMDDMEKSIQERISSLSEEIGELRSSILEKERTLNQIETQNKKVIDVFNEIKPDNFRRELEKKEEEITKNRAELESFMARQKELKEEMENIKKIMEKVKSFENLVGMSEKITERLSQIEENKKYTSRLTSKVENIFSELNNRMKDFKNYMEKIDMNDETIKELMKSLDIMEIKVEKVVSKDNVEEIKKELEGKIKNNKMDLEDKIYDLKDFLEDIMDKSGGSKLLKSKKVMPWRMEIEKKMKEIEKLLGSSKSEVLKIGNFKKELNEVKSEIKRMDDRLHKVSQKESVKPPYIPQETAKTSNKSAEEPTIKPTSEIPVNVEKWLSENVNKGYTLEEMKESLRRGGYDPSYVDVYFAKK